MLFITFALLLSACAAPSPSQPVTDTAFPTFETLSTPEPTQPPAQVEPSPAAENQPTMTMTTYTDDSAGFSIHYPASWFIDASATANAESAFAYSVSISTWNLYDPATPPGKGQSGIPEGGTKIDIGVTKQAMTLEDAIALQAQNELGIPILARKDVALANGLPAVILDMEGMAGFTRTLITVLNGNVIYVSSYGNLEPFEAIALSLRTE
jgi:hypothetical protein